MPKRNKFKEELKRVKEDLYDLKLYIDEFSDFVPLPISTVNPIGIVINVNKAFELLTGFRAIDMLGKHITDLFLEKNKIRKIEEKVIKKGRVKGTELTLLAKNKREIPVSVSASIRRDEKGNFIGYFIAMTDISWAKKTQQILEKKVKERTRELQRRIEELEKIHRLTVGRELKMVELKRKIKSLEAELKKLKTSQKSSTSA